MKMVEREEFGTLKNVRVLRIDSLVESVANEEEAKALVVERPEDEYDAIPLEGARRGEVGVLFRWGIYEMHDGEEGEAPSQYPCVREVVIRLYGLLLEVHYHGELDTELNYWAQDAAGRYGRCGGAPPSSPKFWIDTALEASPLANWDVGGLLDWAKSMMDVGEGQQ